MRRWRLWIILLIAAVASALGVRHVHNVKVQKLAEKKLREAHNQAELLKYSQNIKPRITRRELKDYLQGHGTVFREQCCNHGFHAWAIIVKVGEEDVPWFCSEWPVYVAFEFTIAEPYNLPLPINAALRKKVEQHELEIFPGESDVFTSVHLVSNGEGCL